MMEHEHSHQGERFVPHQSNAHEINVNMLRYLYAMKFCEGKKVLDVGCGCGLGTYMYSLVAKEVTGIDYKDEAFAYAKRYPHGCDASFVLKDVEKDLLPAAEVVVALEVIEHLANPDYFLGQLKCDRLVFSIPLHSLEISYWHKYDFRTIDDVANLIGKYFKIEEMKYQNNIWVIGTAVPL